jgi:hypothetical protein
VAHGEVYLSPGPTVHPSDSSKELHRRGHRHNLRRRRGNGQRRG